MRATRSIGGTKETISNAMRIATNCVSEQDDVRYAFLVYCQKQAAQAVEAWWPEIQAVAQAPVPRRDRRYSGRGVRGASHAAKRGLSDY